MKRYCARIGLLIGSMMMALVGNLIALGAAIVGSNRAWPVAVANDQALNAALVGRAGSEDETVSSRAASAGGAGAGEQAGAGWGGCVRGGQCGF